MHDFIEAGDEIEAQMKGVAGPVAIYEVQGVQRPYNIRLRKRCEILVLLAERLSVRGLRMSDKVVTEDAGRVWITDLCETAAILAYAGEVVEW